MPRLMYGSVDANGVNLRYYRTGGEKPPVVLLHGLTDAGLAWNWLPVDLEPEFDVVAYDARGHGYSDAPESGYSPEHHAVDLLALVDALRLERPTLLGHSMGGVVATVAAAMAPKAFRGLVLEDPAWYSPAGHPPVDAEARRAELHEFLTSLKGKDIDEIEAMCKAENPYWHESEAFQWAKSKQRAAPQVGEFFTSTWPALDELLPRIPVPGLLVTGDPERGAIVTEETAHHAERLWRGLRVLHIPGAGHSIHREQYKPYLLEVRRFLRRLH